MLNMTRYEVVITEYETTKRIDVIAPSNKPWSDIVETLEKEYGDQLSGIRDIRILNSWDYVVMS